MTDKADTLPTDTGALGHDCTARSPYAMPNELAKVDVAFAAFDAWNMPGSHLKNVALFTSQSPAQYQHPAVNSQSSATSHRYVHRLQLKSCFNSCAWSLLCDAVLFVRSSCVELVPGCCDHTCECGLSLQGL